MIPRSIVALALAAGLLVPLSAQRATDGPIRVARPVLHKRLMLFATLMLTVAAADRVALVLWFLVSDLLFLNSAGEAITQTLARIVVW